jgi:hypothetical protein
MTSPESDNQDSAPSVPSEELERQAILREFTEFPGKFLDFLPDIEKLRRRGSLGSFSEDRMDKGVTLEEIETLKGHAASGVKLGLPEMHGHLPFLEVENDALFLSVTSGTDEAAKGFEITSDMIRFMHADKTRPDQFPHVYELLKAIPRYIGRVRIGVGLPIDLEMVRATLKHLLFVSSDGLKDTVHRELFSDYRTAQFLKIAGAEVNEDGFRAWLETFHPQNRMHLVFAQELRERISEEVEARVQALKISMASFFEKLPAEKPSWKPKPHDEIDAGCETDRPTAIKDDYETDKPFPLVKKTLRPGMEPGQVQAGVRLSFGNLSLPLLDTVEAEQQEPVQNDEVAAMIRQFNASEDDQGSALAHQFANYIGGLIESGAVFNFGTISEICELLFENDINWFDSSGKILWSELDNLNLYESFSECPDAIHEVENFASQLRYWAMDLRREGLATAEERAKFVMAMRAVNRVNK